MKSRSDRGNVYTSKLKRAIVFNGCQVTTAIIELDHINYGLDLETNKLNTKRRTNFTNGDIEKFVHLPERYEKTYSVFIHFIKCPVRGKFEGKEFVMIFKTDYHKSDEIHTVTIYPNW